MIKDATLLASWMALYDAALNFKKIEPWKWMYDDELFGVQDPVSGEIGYCCILGNLEEVFALNVYLGAEGLFGHRIMQCYRDGDPKDDLVLVQKCLMASFEDRGRLVKEDLDIIKALGFKFRGKNAWPMFQNYQPGYFPWFLTNDDIPFLTTALEQALEVVLRCRDDKSLITTDRDDLFFVRMPEIENNTVVWRDSYQQPAHFSIAIPDDGHFDEVGLQRLLKNIKKRSGTWEFDLFHYPEPIRDGEERPCFPYTYLVMDHKSGLALDMEIISLAGYVKKARDRIISLVERTKSFPEQIQVRNGRAFDILKPIVDKLGVKLSKVVKLPHLEMCRQELVKSLSRGQRGY